MQQQKFGLLTLALLATALLTTLALTVEAIAESKAQSSTRSQTQSQAQTPSQSPPATRTQEREQSRDREQERKEERNQMPIYGSMMMTEREMEQHRATMRSFKTEKEREAYRKEHHQRMMERAHARGLSLPDEPPGSTLSPNK